MTTIEPFRVVEVMEAAWALEAAGRSIVWFCVGEPDFGTPPDVVQSPMYTACQPGSARGSLIVGGFVAL